jgi:hypothetical protein
VTITRDDLKKAKTRGTLHLDGADYYQNHYQCVEYPRLAIVITGPRGRKSKVVGARTFYVDGFECPDLDAVLTLLNAEPRKAEAS